MPKIVVLVQVESCKGRDGGLQRLEAPGRLTISSFIRHTNTKKKNECLITVNNELI